MKRPGLFKTLRTLSLMTMLSIAAIPNIPKTAQAQTQGIPDGIEFLTREQLEQARLDALEDSKICDRVFRENSNVQIASVMTPQERQTERDAVRAAGECSPSSLFKPDRWRTVTVDTGTRPDLDKRLREDTTGATLFK